MGWTMLDVQHLLLSYPKFETSKKTTKHLVHNYKNSFYCWKRKIKSDYIPVNWSTVTTRPVELEIKWTRSIN